MFSVPRVQGLKLTFKESRCILLAQIWKENVLQQMKNVLIKFVKIFIHVQKTEKVRNKFK